MSVSRVWQEVHVEGKDIASVASNGAAARVGQVGPFGREGRIKAFYWTPTGADQGANTASYRRILWYNGGSAGTATATANILASIGFTASGASLKPMTGVVVYPASGTAASSGTFGSADILYYSHNTVGGDDASGSVLRAGQAKLIIEFIG